MPGVGQRLNRVTRAPVLPHDGIINRRPSVTLPDNRRLALIGNADGRDIRVGDLSLTTGAFNGDQGRLPNRLRIVFDPRGLGKDLLEILRNPGADAHLIIDNNRGRTRGTLVNRTNKFGHISSQASYLLLFYVT